MKCLYFPEEKLHQLTVMIKCSWYRVHKMSHFKHWFSLSLCPSVSKLKIN